jgi:transcription antitermination factor NusA-like protein
MPARYLRKDASEEDKEVFEHYKNLIKEIQTGQRSGLIMPSERDPETRERLFDIELLGD